MSIDDPHAAVAEFKNAVNMSSKTLTAWLTTKESKAVGFNGRLAILAKPTGVIR